MNWQLNLFRKTAEPFFLLCLPGLPREDFSWNAREGWLKGFRSLGIPVVEAWIERQKGRPEKILADIRKKKPQAVFLLGGDHHLEMLHREESDRCAWRELGIPTICNCDEAIVDSPFPGSLEKTERALATFDFFTYCDERAERVFAAKGGHALWWPQYVDAQTFRQGRRHAQKEPQAYFRGQFRDHGLPGVYATRQSVLAAVNGKEGYILEEAYRPRLSIAEAVERKDRYRFCLHAPSNCPGFTSAFFEGAAVGSAVLQYRLPADQPRSRALLVEGQHYFGYNANQPEELREILRSLRADPDKVEAVANAGREETIKKHTIEMRIRQMLVWLSSFRPDCQELAGMAQPVSRE